ncbi:alginate lyase family protein [Butyricicoccus pullicaecorum]|uniref:alginate lyase family protein n=1 Tax=Butyricicoccus pullicaecorum TaxID=501571 RepID=UPI003990C59A
MNFVQQSLNFLAEHKKLAQTAHFIRPDAAKEIIAHADELMHQTFTFNKTWDMERCLTPYTLPVIDWNGHQNDDPEWCFMLNRMDYLDHLLLASLLTGEIAYADKAKEYILNWIAAHPTIASEPSTRTLDTGIRVMNWMEALPYLSMLHVLTEDELTRITDSMLAQMQYLKENYLPKYKTSNWGSIQTCAIVSVLPFLRADFLSDPLYQWALDEMTLQFSIQVYPDGMHWEQSTMYHIEVLNYGMKAVHYMGLHLQPCPSVVKEQVYALAKALAGQLMPSGEIETFGDSDRVCARDVLSRAALLFDDPTFRFVGLDELDPESLYVLGVPAAQRYAAMTASVPQSLHYDGEDSGMYTLRSSWDKDASFTMFTNGSLGSGHGHSDNLHLSVCYQGDPVLIDSGRFTYREDHPLRVQLKGMAAHNGVMIDDKAYCVPSDSWGYADFGLPLKNYVRHAGNLHYFEGAMLGHDPLQVWVRKVIIIDPAIWMIVDEVKCDGAHEAHSRLHFDPAVTVSPAGECHRVTTPHAALTLTCPGTVSYTSEPCSLRYNEQQPHTVVHSKTAFTDSATLITTLCGDGITVQDAPVFQNLTEPTAPDFAQARKFILSPTESYTVAVYSKEIYRGKKVLSCEGMPYHAKCVVIHEKDGHKQLTILKA